MKHELIDKYLNKVIVYKVSGITLSDREIKKLSITSLFNANKKLHTSEFISEVINKNKKRLFFMEVYAYNSQTPLKVVVSHNKAGIKGDISIFFVPELSVKSGILTK